MSVDFNGGGDEAQVPGRQAPERQQAVALVLQLHVEVIDLLVFGDDLASQLRVSFQEGFYGGIDRLFSQGAPVDQAFLDLPEFPS